MNTFGYMVAGYAVFGLGLLCYSISLFRRRQTVERQIRQMGEMPLPKQP